jgi:N-hydroxyarylamine O-acetyltransferase
MNLSAYFKRINYTGNTEPTLETLRQLHRAHMQHIPFENLNIHIPRPIILDEALLFEKIVNENRGGFCFEQNGLFSVVLRDLGYEVYRLEANVFMNEASAFGIPMSHMNLMVVIDDSRYLADVGFGASFIEPLELDNPEIQKQQVGSFQIRHDGKTAYYYEYLDGTDMLTLAYRFFLEAHELADYEDACHYMQTSPKTHFTQKRVCTRLTDEGRITLSEGKLIQTAWNGTRHETPVENEEQFHALLQEHFGIDVQTQAPQLVES